MTTKFLEKIKRWLKSKRFWKRTALVLVGIPILLFFTVVLIVYNKQDEIVKELIVDLNEDFNGTTEIKGSHVSMFENFPYISIDLEEFKIHESKEKNTTPLAEIHDLFVSFNLWTILTGKMEIKKIKLKNGNINLVQNKNGEFNLLKALSSNKEVAETEEDFHLDLKKIELEDIDITKLNEANNLKVEAYIKKANSKFKSSTNHVKSAFDVDFVLNIISNGDTTFLKHKHIEMETELDFQKGKDILTIQPTKVKLEGSEFNMKGSIDFLNDMFLDLSFSGNKPNFDLLIALAPEEVIESMHDFENEGDIYIHTTIKGKSINGNNPSIKADFGCHKGHFTNVKNKKRLDNLNFEAYFTNGVNRDRSTMKFVVKKFSVKPELGKFKGDLKIVNFNAPEVDLKLNTEFKLDFVSKFLNLEHVQNLKGDATIDIEFSDVIDPKNPQHALSKFKDSYKMDINLKDISFSSDLYSLPIKDFDLFTKIEGHQASIIKCSLLIGKSDLSVTGIVDDLPAIVHHLRIPVDTKLKITSKYIDLFELTGSDENAIDEQISDLSLDFDFKASARAFTESKYLPEGEFFIENLYAKLKHYPHTFHDFHADIFVEERDLRVVDFKGMIDKSDFLFTGKLEHYEKWFDEHPGGDSKIEFNLVSKALQLESLFSYKGDNYVPEEYKHEEFDDLKIHGYTYLHYNDGLKSMDLNIDKFEARMKVHPLRFENFKGRIHYENEDLMIEDFHGKLGNSIFKTTLHYYLGKNEKIKKRDNHFSITASRLDIDELIKYNPAPAIKNNNAKNKGKEIDHDAGFNIYNLPFTEMTYHIDIEHLNYHRYLIHNLKGALTTTPDHYIYIDHLNMDAADGHLDINGYFNGSDPEMIYFSPDISATNIDIDKLMFKFENFGQDHIVSENLHGRFTGKITGKIHMHTDLVPKIDDSEIHMDVNVTQGRLENYSLLHYMSDYFKDKNLNKVIFDTLINHIDINNGEVIIPKMSINSSLGHIEISGKQNMDGTMEYYLRIPWKMAMKSASGNLFGRKRSEEELSAVDDEIQYESKRAKYVNIKIIGDKNDYKVSLGKDKTTK